MKPRGLVCVAAVMFAAVLACPIRLSAQGGRQAATRYTVIDLGTLGGSFSVALGNSNNGWVTGLSRLPGDQNAHAFLWRHGVMTDLGTLGGPNSIPAFAPPDESGAVGGGAETSTPDPNGEDVCGFGTHLICLPFVWRNAVMTALPTLGGNNGFANKVNNRGQVAGAAESATQVPPCVQGLATPVVWYKGSIQELPLFPADLAGVALAINDKGEAAGFTASCVGGHPLMWQNGIAIDLGSLGGTFGVANAINNQGKVVGNSNLQGDATSHAFLWQNGLMSDLGTLPGDFGSVALGINNEGQVVGDSSDANGEHPFLWQNGVMTNLNDLIPAASPLFLIDANGINSRGEISGLAFDTNSGALRGYLAIPINGTAKGDNDRTQSGRGETRNITLPPNLRKLIRRQLGRRYNFAHIRTLPLD